MYIAVSRRVLLPEIHWLQWYDTLILVKTSKKVWIFFCFIQITFEDALGINKKKCDQQKIIRKRDAKNHSMILYPVSGVTYMGYKYKGQKSFHSLNVYLLFCFFCVYISIVKKASQSLVVCLSANKII